MVLDFSTNSTLVKLTFWGHQVLQQVSAYHLCLKAGEKRRFLLISLLWCTTERIDKNSLEWRTFTFCWIKHVRKFFRKVQHWKKNHSNYFNKSTSNWFQVPVNYLRQATLFQTEPVNCRLRHKRLTFGGIRLDCFKGRGRRRWRGPVQRSRGQELLSDCDWRVCRRRESWGAGHVCNKHRGQQTHGVIWALLKLR